MKNKIIGNWVKIGNGLEITEKQQFNGMTYPKILKKVKEEEIATYELLQKLRNSGKYEFLREFWVFVPNPDEISKKNGDVARWYAGSDRAVLFCGRNPALRLDLLGVFLIRKGIEK